MRAAPSLVVAFALFVVALGAQTAAPDSAERERMAKQLETEVMAPCCWSQQVSEHQSPAASEMRADIRKRLADGQSHDEIIAAYVDQYGERILAVPRPRGFKALLFVLPPLLFLATAALVVVVIRRAARRGASASTEPVLAPAGSARLDRQLDDELRDLD